MFNYIKTEINQAERIFSPDCSVPFFQHEMSVQSTFASGRLVNIYKVRENLPDSTASLFYWVTVLPDVHESECSCSWHRCTGEMCQHIATVLLFKWFELKKVLPTERLARRVVDTTGIGEGPLVVRQAREIILLHFDFDAATQQRLLNVRRRYQQPPLP